MIGWILLLILVSVFIYKKWQQRHEIKIPGPTSWPLIGNSFRFIGTAEHIWNSMQELNKKYYPIYKLSNGFIGSVHLQDPDDIELILSSRSHLRKSKFYDFLQSWLGTGLLTSDGAKWYHRRKLLTPGFHFDIIQQFFSVFVDHSEKLVHQLQNDCEKPYTNITALITKFTLHTICETAMGTKLDEKKKRNSEYVLATFKMGQLLLDRIRRPWLLLTFIYNMTKMKSQQTSLISTLHNFSKSVIEKRKQVFQNVSYKHEENDEYKKKPVAMLDLLLSLQNHGAEILDEEIREEVDTFIFEGHDTTSSGISFALMLLANHPNVQEMVFEEINQVMSGSNRPFEFSDIQQLRYLELVIKETLRLYPSVPIIGRRVDFDLITSTSHVIRKDTIVSIHIYGLHHNPKFYPNPEKFDPDRFLPQNRKGCHPYSYIPFSAGPRNCIGQKFAMLEMKTAIASIIRNFILVPIDKLCKVTLISHMILKTSKDINIKFKKRRKMLSS